MIDGARNGWTLLTIDHIRNAGFGGFRTVKQLRESRDEIPRLPGVYLVLRDTETSHKFLDVNPTQARQGRSPTIPVAELQQRWIESTPVLYIGKAGKPGGQATLRKRLDQYIRHGQGRCKNHWGGRAIWQLAENERLILCWKPTPNEDPGEVEGAMIVSFAKHFGARPFANRRN